MLSVLSAASSGGGPAVPLAVLAAAVLHASWNALAHGMKDQLVGFCLISVASTGFAAILAVLSPVPNAGAFAFIMTSALLQAGYLALLLKAYQLGDFAQMYPLARGTSPLLVAVWSAGALAEPTSAWQLGGVLIVSCGLIGLAVSDGLPGRAQLPALAAALATGVTIASYTITDGVGVRHSTTVVGYVAWGFLLQGPIFLTFAFAARRRRLLSGLAMAVWIRGLSGGILSVTAYGLVVWAQARGNLATIAALRETSIVIAAGLGAVFFHERLGRRRLVASVVVVAGIAVMEFARA